jgi:hypothetical protein
VLIALPLFLILPMTAFSFVAMALLQLMLFIALLWLKWALVRRLRTNHPVKYEQLGGPGVLSINPDTRRALYSFVYDRKDLRMRDEVLSLIVSRLRPVNYACIACYVYLLLCLWAFIGANFGLWGR